jgi:hypothetical protein
MKNIFSNVDADRHQDGGGAREKQPVHPIGGPPSLDLEIIAKGKADEIAMPTIASTAMLKTAEPPSGIPALIRSSVVFSAGGREAICRMVLGQAIDFDATKCNCQVKKLNLQKPCNAVIKLPE